MRRIFFDVEWLNYHHLLYFWMVAKEGSIVRASKELRLAHPTISGQIHRLEDVLGEKLFERKGRDLVLTDAGRVAYRYANEIFALGQEFQDTLKGRSTEKPLRLVVGVSDVIAKSIVHRILEPAFQLNDKVRIICREARSPWRSLRPWCCSARRRARRIVLIAAKTARHACSISPTRPATGTRSFRYRAKS